MTPFGTDGTGCGRGTTDVVHLGGQAGTGLIKEVSKDFLNGYISPSPILRNAAAGSVHFTSTLTLGLSVHTFLLTDMMSHYVC